jgi:hypothetical protein
MTRGLSAGLELYFAQAIARRYLQPLNETQNKNWPKGKDARN